MSQWKLPVIDSKKQLNEQEDYNFVNKDKKKLKDTNGAMGIIDDLKRKIEQQKKQIDNRNTTIMGLQRNFQSLSGIVKHQKSQSAALKAQLESYKNNSQNGDKRALQYHQRNIILTNQNKTLKQQLSISKKQHMDCYKILAQCQSLRQQNKQLETSIHKISERLDTLNQQKNQLYQQLQVYKKQQTNKRALNIRIIDLEEQLRKQTEINNVFADKLKIKEDQLATVKGQNVKLNQKMGQSLKKCKQWQIKNNKLAQHAQMLEKQKNRMRGQLEQIKNNMGSKDIASKMRDEQQQKMKEQIRSSKAMCQQLKLQIMKINQQLQQQKRDRNKSQKMIVISEKQLKQLRNKHQQYQQQQLDKQQQYVNQCEKLTKWVSELNQRLNQSHNKNDELNQKLIEQANNNVSTNSKLSLLSEQLEQINDKMIKQRQKYQRYMMEIDSLEKQSLQVVITHKGQINGMKGNYSEVQKRSQQYLAELNKLKESAENMKKYITSLQTQVNTKTQQISLKNKQNKLLEDKISLLSGQQAKLAEMISEQRRRAEQIKRQSEQSVIKSQKHIEEQRIRSLSLIEKQRQQSIKYQRMLAQYRSQQQKLKQLVNKQKLNLQQLAKNKQQQIQQLIKLKQQAIQKQRKNNKLLWSDNKRLKDMQNKLREQAEEQLKMRQNQRKAELQRLRADLQSKYKQQLDKTSSKKMIEQSNSSQLKKILQDKAQQVKLLSQANNKLKNQLQFYKNRNKQLEGVVSRTEKTYKEQLSALEKDSKANKQVVSVLDKKLSEANLVRQQNQKKYKEQISKITAKLNNLREKYQDQKIQQKIALVHKSILQFQSSLKAVSNTLSCNYCVQPVKQCVRLRECGHIFCRKCKAGYQPNCGQCKKSGVPVPDKMIDQTVSKAGYMKVLLETVKDDLGKINL